MYLSSAMRPTGRSTVRIRKLAGSITFASGSAA